MNTYYRALIIALFFLLNGSHGKLLGQSYFTSDLTDEEILDELKGKYKFMDSGEIKIPHLAENPDWLVKFYQPTIDSLFSQTVQVDSFIRLDFNNNNELDVIFSFGYYGYFTYLVFDVGSIHSKAVALMNFSQPIFNFVDYSDGVLTYKFVEKRGWKIKNGHKSTNYEVVERRVVYKYGGIMEYNENKDVHNPELDSIVVSTTHCLGSCPVYQLVIRDDLPATLNAKKYCKSEEGIPIVPGKYRAPVAKEKISLMEEVLGYIDFMRLDSKYAVDWTDAQTITTTVYTRDGSSKTINDYGKQGTMGLSYFYSLLSDIYRSSAWEKQ